MAECRGPWDCFIRLRKLVANCDIERPRPFKEYKKRITKNVNRQDTFFLTFQYCKSLITFENVVHILINIGVFVDVHNPKAIIKSL